MNAEKKPRAQRMSAGARREAVLNAAIVEFAALGLHGASTEAIAGRVGISQPYIFRLFGTKKKVFLAAAERVCDRILVAFRDAAATDPTNPFEAMGHAFVAMLAGREDFLMLLQAYAACDDADVREVMRRRMRDVYTRVEELTGADEVAIQRFIAHGMLLMITAAIDLPALVGKEVWARNLLTEQGFEHDDA